MRALSFNPKLATSLQKKFQLGCLVTKNWWPKNIEFSWHFPTSFPVNNTRPATRQHPPRAVLQCLVRWCPTQKMNHFKRKGSSSNHGYVSFEGINKIYFFCIYVLHWFMFNWFARVLYCFVCLFMFWLHLLLCLLSVHVLFIYLSCIYNRFMVFEYEVIQRVFSWHNYFWQQQLAIVPCHFFLGMCECAQKISAHVRQ